MIMWHAINITTYLFLKDTPEGFLSKAMTDNTAVAATSKATAALLVVGTAYPNKHHSKDIEEGAYYYFCWFLL